MHYKNNLCRNTLSYLLVILVSILNAQEESTILNSLDTITSAAYLKDSTQVQEESTIDDILLVDNVMSLLHGKDAGLYIRANSFTPGASSRMTFRGFRSFYGDNQPTLLWNGIPLDNAEWNNGLAGTDQSNRLMDLDPTALQDISMIRTMVQRASYGIWGGDGIIETQSKNRRKGDATITFLSSIGMNQVSQLPKLQDIYAPGITSDGDFYYFGPETGNRNSWGPPINQLIYDGDPSYPYDNNGRLFLSNGQSGQSANVYNPYDFFQNSLSTYNSLNFEGGSDRISYSTSASVLNKEGIIPFNAYTRYHLNPNIFFSITDKWKLNIHSLISVSNTHRNQKGSNLQGIALAVFRTPPTFDNGNMLDDPANNSASYQISGGSHRSASAGVYANPYWSINKNKDFNTVRRQILVIKNSYSFKDYLDLEATVGLDHYIDRRLGGSAVNPGITTNGNSYNHLIDYTSKTADVSLNFQDSLTDKMELKSTLGINVFQSNSDFDITTGSNSVFGFDSFLIHQLRYGNYFNSTINYANWLSLVGTARIDYSNKFGADTNGFLSYGLGLNVAVSELINAGRDINKTLPYELHVNASYGKFGNLYGGRQDYGKYENTLLSGDGWIDLGNVNSTELNLITRSTDLHSEIIEGYDLELKLILPKIRSSLSLTLYDEQSKHLIGVDNISTSSGFSLLESNYGSISNSGIEISIGSEAISSDRIKWYSQIGFLTNSNVVNEISPFSQQSTLGGFSLTQSVVAEGHPYGVIYGRGFLRENDQVIIGSDGFPLFSNESKILGDPNPDWVMSLFNNIQIGQNIQISALLEFKKGGDIYCGTCGTLDYLGHSERSALERDEVFVFEGITESGAVNTQEVELAPSDGEYRDFYRVRYGFGTLTEMSIYDASWLKLRRLSISYNLSSLWSTSFKGQLDLGVYAENIMLKTNYPGIDPETNLVGNSGGLGIDYYNNPGTKTYGIFVNAQF